MLKRMQEAGENPPALENRPILLGRLSWFYGCFTELSDDRSYSSGGPLRLSTGQIHAYWSAYKLPNFEGFASKIKLIDGVWYTKMLAKQKKDSEKTETAKGSVPPSLKSG